MSKIPTEQVYGLFNDSFPPVLDGVTLTVQNYVHWLTKMGNRTCVVTPWNPVRPQNNGFDLYRYFSLPIFNRKPYRYGYPKADPMIWYRMSHIPFRLVHAHCPFSSGRLALYAARTQRVPLVATFHSKYRTDLERALPHFMVKQIMQRIVNFYEAADEVWIPQADVEETIRQYGYHGRVTVVENGNDLGEEDIRDIDDIKSRARQALGISRDELSLLFVGQHIKEKGVETIIHTIALLQDIPLHMDFIGTGYAKDDMRNLIEKLGLQARITMHGVVSDRELLKRHYAAADLFLFPSFYDNAPLVVREAAMMGTPSILLRGSTAAEVIIDGKNGFLAEPTAESYAAKIREIYTNPTWLHQAANGARATLSRSWKDVMAEVAQRYKEIEERYGKK